MQGQICWNKSVNKWLLKIQSFRQSNLHSCFWRIIQAPCIASNGKISSSDRARADLFLRGEEYTEEGIVYMRFNGLKRVHCYSQLIDSIHSKRIPLGEFHPLSNSPISSSQAARRAQSSLIPILHLWN